MKKNSRFAGFYMGLIFFLMYLPIAVVIVFSFNESKLPVKFTGFSRKWHICRHISGISSTFPHTL